MFGDIEIETHKFHCYRNQSFLEDVDIDSVLLSNKIFSDKKKYKHFTGYSYNNYKIKQMQIMFPKTSLYVKSYDGQTNWMYFFIDNDDFLEKYNTTWDKLGSDIKKEFDIKPFYKRKILKTKIKCYSDEATDFHNQ